MLETLCVCCGAETDRDWNLSTPFEESMCAGCSAEFEMAETAKRIDEFESIEYFRLRA